MSDTNLTAGYPFNRGRWVGPTESPFVLQPPLAKATAPIRETSDVVQVSKAATNSSPSDGNRVKVQSGDSLNQLLPDRGYSLNEMLEKKVFRFSLNFEQGSDYGYDRGITEESHAISLFPRNLALA